MSFRKQSVPWAPWQRYRALRVIFLVFTVTSLSSLLACTPPPPSPDATLVAAANDSTDGPDIEWGQLVKDGDFTFGAPINEVIRVLNCNNPSHRSDHLRESRGVERAVEWSVEGGVGLELQGAPVGIGGVVESTIASGYALEVNEQIERSRELDLPVQPDSSVEYTIEWQTLVWSGYLPFRFQSAEERIRYFYTRHLFGEVVSVEDTTLRDCGRIPPEATNPPLDPVPPVDEPPERPTDLPVTLEEPTSLPAATSVATATVERVATSPPAPDVQTLPRFEVKADIPKNRTGISVSTGETIRIEYLDGQWTPEIGVAGQTTGCGFRWDDPYPENVWLFPPEQRGAALVGYINGTPFFVGCRPVDIVAPTSGELYLGMSDCQECYWDNAGSLFVLVSVQSR